MRATGVRISYEEVPPAVRAWVEASLGSPVVTAAEQTGGMSPGCATRLMTAAGTTAFVKATGATQNAGTVELFRREAEVLTSLRALPPVPHRPALLGVYDDGDWVALLLDDVDGRPPDLTDPGGTDAIAVRDLVERQARELTPSPIDPASRQSSPLRRLPEMAETWRQRWADLAGAPDGILPPWTAGRIRDLYRRAATVPQRLTDETLCHWDVREDNLLIRPDGAAMIVDWGMACLGPSWGDAFMLALTWADTPAFDSLTAALPVDPEVVTDLLVAIAGSQAWRGAQPAPPGLPTFAAYCRAEAGRGFAGVFRRLN